MGSMRNMTGDDGRDGWDDDGSPAPSRVHLIAEHRHGDEPGRRENWQGVARSRLSLLRRILSGEPRTLLAAFAITVAATALCSVTLCVTFLSSSRKGIESAGRWQDPPPTGVGPHGDAAANSSKTVAGMEVSATTKRDLDRLAERDMFLMDFRMSEPLSRVLRQHCVTEADLRDFLQILQASIAVGKANVKVRDKFLVRNPATGCFTVPAGCWAGDLLYADADSPTRAVPPYDPGESPEQYARRVGKAIFSPPNTSTFGESNMFALSGERSLAVGSRLFASGQDPFLCVPLSMRGADGKTTKDAVFYIETSDPSVLTEADKLSVQFLCQCLSGATLNVR